MPQTNDAGFISDAERGCIVAEARAAHWLRTAYLGDAAPEFTDAMAQVAVARVADQRRSASAFIDAYTAETDRLRAEAAASDRYFNGWRNN